MPIFRKIWNYLKYFTTQFANGANRPPATSGSAAAALISVGIGCLTMMISHHFAETSIAADTFIWGLGKWIPGSEIGDKLAGHIGSYTGKETIMLLSWLGSWVILHNLLKDKQVKTRTIFMWTFGLIVAATVMSWQPLFPYLPLT
jgi:fumarate reductase subunit D